MQNSAIVKTEALIEKELVESLSCGDDMVRVERLRSAALRSAFEGRLV